MPPTRTRRGNPGPTMVEGEAALEPLSAAYGGSKTVLFCPGHSHRLATPPSGSLRGAGPPG